MSTFTELGLDAARVEQLAAQGITSPSDIQAQAIPALLEGKDVLVQAPTGTGKTLAYLLPTLQRIDPSLEALQAVVLVPTQELGIQVRDVAKELLKAYPGAVGSLIGGANPARQAEALKKKPRVIVGTPGRVLEFLRNGKLSGLGLKVMVVDEVDTLIEDGKMRDLEHIFKAFSPKRQTVFCSATLGEKSLDLGSRWLKTPVEIRVGDPLAVPDTIQHLAFVVDTRDKLDMIRRLVRHYNPVGALAFVNQTKDLDWFVNKLKFHKLKVEGMHGGAGKLDRADTMRRFRSGDLQLLLTTDLSARGLDVSSVGVVFNFDLPHDPETYVHRVGRTGRMGKAGTAITLVTKPEAHVLDKLEKAIGITFERPVYRLGEVREKDAIDEKIEKGKAQASAKKAKEKAEAPKKKKKDKDNSPSSKQLAKGRAKKAKRQASGDWKKATKPTRAPEGATKGKPVPPTAASAPEATAES
jgi:superfamily II DNA/RNA helicase